MFDFYDHVRIINLARRVDRRQEMIEELASCGVAIDGQRTAFFPARAVDDANGFYSSGAHGCYLSHLAVLNEAGERSVLIIEDDCDFAPETQDAKVPDCDIFCAGYLGVAGGDEMLGAHLIGYSPGIAKRFAAYLEKLLADGHPVPVDGAMAHFRRDNPDIRIAYAVPVLGLQRPSMTDIGDRKRFDGWPLVSFARKLKRFLVRRKLRAEHESVRP